MEYEFDGGAVRLARTYHGYSLDDVADQVEKTRQYIHKLETGQAAPTPALAEKLAETLAVEAGFFFMPAKTLIAEQQVHFRKLVATRSMVKQVAMAKAEVLRRVVDHLDGLLDLPQVRIPQVGDAGTAEDIERAAERCRKEWALGLGPISNMVRVAENAGAVVTTFDGVSAQIDALSVPVRRPLIVLNEQKGSVCRLRFDIGHELGHLVLHDGRETGDRSTEAEANRFASAFLLPRTMMGKLFPRPRNGRLNWQGISDFKVTWRVSKAALLYRAHQLGLIDENLYRSGFITLKRTGEAISEREDHLIEPERPELIYNALAVLRDRAAIGISTLAKQLRVHPSLLKDVLRLPASEDSYEPTRTNVVPFRVDGYR